MAETFLNMPLVKEVILPFLLVFALVFAVLQKTEILGKEKRQTDAIVALVFGLIAVTVGRAVDLINNLIPFVAVALVVLLLFLLLYGVSFKQGEFKVDTKIQMTIGILAAVAIAVALLYFSGGWEWLKEILSSQNIWPYILIIAAIGAAVWVGFSGGGSSKGSGSGG